MANQFAGRRSLIVRLNAIGRRTAQEVGQAVRRGGLAIENNAADRIISPPKTGRVYPSKSRNGAFHQASAPGEAPAADTGRLHQSLTSVQTRNGPDVYQNETAANAPYAIALELGTAKIAPRPYMQPAFDEVRPQVEASIRAAIVRGARSGGR